MGRILAITVLALIAFSLAARSEDWVTSDGTTYKDVKVLKVDADAVTIIDQDGGALVPLAKLGPVLQKRFGYDPAKAKVAAEERDKADMDNIKALQAEKDKMNAEQIAGVQAMAKADSATNSTNGNFNPGSTPDHLTGQNAHIRQEKKPQGDDTTRTHYTGM
jgi:FKBP-type peptidyl-prolyl cis-trans isomerase